MMVARNRVRVASCCDVLVVAPTMDLPNHLV